jgi:hypothetical protein
MDLHQLIPQVGTQPAGGDLMVSGAGGPLGSPSRAREFSTVFHAVSYKADGSRETKSRVPQAEADDRPSGATTPVHRTASHKVDSRRDAESRDPQAKTDDRPSGATTPVHRTASHKADSRRDAESRDPQAKTDDGTPKTTSDVSTTGSQETSSGTDTESPAAQSKTSDAPSTTTSGSDPLLLSPLGATVVASAPPVASTQEAAVADASMNPADGLSGTHGAPTIQPISQLAEGITSAVGSKTGLTDLVDQNATSATGDAVAIVPSPIPVGYPLSAGTDTVIPIVEKSDISQPLTALQGQKAGSSDPHQRLPIMEYQKGAIPQTPVPVGQATVNGQDPAQPVTPVMTQQTRQNGEMVVSQPDRSPVQQTPGKSEPSLHQKNMQAESSEPQTATAFSSRTLTEGQGFNTESDGQRKDDGLKWFSHVDVQSAEVSSRTPQQSVAESPDSGPQSLSYQQGQGGTPPNIKTAPAPAVPSSSQANRLSPDPETAPLPLTHAVQFDLAPADFGQLRVRLVLSDHTVHTHLSTDRAELGQMLTSQQEQLGTQLSAAGLDLGRFQVQVDQGRTNHSGQEWQSQSQGGTSQQQRDSRQQEHSPEAPVPSQKRTGVLSLFA